MSNPKGINQYTSRGAANKAHKSNKAAFGKMGAFNISAPTSKSGRGEIAKQLRRIRNTTQPSSFGYSDGTIHEITSNAAASTRLRNLTKNKKSR